MIDGQAVAHFYRDGGTLPPDAPSYITRPADSILQKCIDHGDFAYVLAPRQMGKSSLMARTVNEIRQQNHLAAVVDLTKIGESGTNAAASSWYRGLLRLIARELKISFNVKQWWEERDGATNQQLFYEFFADVILPSCSGNVTVFVDEIDSTIPLPFSDDFFTGIRSLYNARATEPAFNRLSFVLLGVATPAELIRDSRRTPFNIGVAIELTDFTVEEALPLVAGLSGNRESNTAAIKRILHWTGGHPFLTQRVCVQLVKEHGDEWTADKIDALVEKLFFAPGARTSDYNLSFVTNRILKSPFRPHLLTLYKKVLSGRSVPHDPRSLVQAEIKLSGLLRTGPGDVLTVRNAIYRQVFDRQWLRDVIAISKVQLVAVPSLVLCAAFLLLWYFIMPLPYNRALRLAQSEDPAADTAYAHLCKFPGYRQTADMLLRQIWERKAVGSEMEDGPFPALVCRLKSLSIHDDKPGRIEAGRLTKPYTGLQFVVRHSAAVNKIVYSPDGSKIATAGNDRTVRIWDGATGTLIREMRHDREITAVAFSPDGARLATAGSDNTALIWDLVSERPHFTALKHDNSILTLEFSLDGTMLATASSDKTARIWETSTGKLITGPLRHDNAVTAVSFSHDGSLLATASFDKTARIWNTQSGIQVSPPLEHSDYVTSVCFSPDDSKLVTAGNDNTARIWDVKTGTPLHEPLQHGNRVNSAVFSHDGTRIATAAYDNTARIWDVATGACTDTLRHRNNVVAVAFSSDDSLLATGSGDKTVRLWNTSTGEPVGTPLLHDGAVTCVTFSPDDSTLASAGDDGTARVWSVREIRSSFVKYRKQSRLVTQTAFTANGRAVLVVDEDTAIHVWSTDGIPTVEIVNWKTVPVRKLAFSADGSKMAIAGIDSCVRLWDILQKKPVPVRLKPHDAVSVVTFSNDGSLLATASYNKIDIWDAVSGHSGTDHIRHGDWINDVQFNPDGTKLATASSDGTVRVWDAANGNQLAILKHDGPVYSCTFSPDGNRIVTTSSGNRVQLWDIGSSEPVSAPARHNGYVYATIFSPDGRHLITATFNRLNYYSLQSGTLIPTASRALAGVWNGSLYPLDESATKVLVPWGLSSSGLELDTVSFETSDDEQPFNGPVDSLIINSWLQKFALRFTPDGNIEPLYNE